MVVSGTYNPRMKMPAIPLSDAAGEIVSVGSRVTKWAVGDRVCPVFAQSWFDGPADEAKRKSSLGAGPHSDGVAREYAAFSEESVVAFPDHLSFDEASTLPCAAVTAWNALSQSGDLKAGETVLTLGTGGVSIFSLQFAKMFGARVIATSSSDEKIERLREMGATSTINYRTDASWQKTAVEAAGPNGIDHVVEVGGAGTLSRSVDAVKIGGHVALIGALSGAGDFDPIKVFMKAVKLQGIFVGSRSTFEKMNRAISTAKLRPVIDRTFDFDQLPEALNYMESGKHFGKIVIKVA